MAKKQHLYFIDNLRGFLIGLVVLHHLAITYGAPGGCLGVLCVGVR